LHVSGVSCSDTDSPRLAADVDSDLLPDHETRRVRHWRFVEPAGIVIYGPVDTRMNTVVIGVAGVPTVATVRVSPPTSIRCPG
jgi:hypothetical protein